MKKYYIMVDGGKAPTVIHKSLDSANKEAKRLSEKEQKNVSVLEVVEEVKMTWYKNPIQKKKRKILVL